MSEKIQLSPQLMFQNFTFTLVIFELPIADFSSPPPLNTWIQALYDLFEEI